VIGDVKNPAPGAGVHGDDAVGAGGGDEIGDELGGDGSAASDLRSWRA